MLEEQGSVNVGCRFWSREVLLRFFEIQIGLGILCYTAKLSDSAQSVYECGRGYTVRRPGLRVWVLSASLATETGHVK